MSAAEQIEIIKVQRQIEELIKSTEKISNILDEILSMFRILIELENDKRI